MADLRVPDSISEEYYQINQAILESFPKYRPPVDFFVFNQDAGQLLLYSHKGERLTNEKVEKAHSLCSEGDLFVSRTDHPIYSEHIIKQLDLVLVDKNLKEAEIADICIRCLHWRLAEFFDQPVKLLFENLYTDLQVITEYLWSDLHRIKLFIRRVHTGDYSLVHHSINTLCLGMWLYLEISEDRKRKDDDRNRKEFDQAAMALLLHDVGMVKIPNFILAKTTPLKPEEKEKIPPHTLSGYKIMHKLDQAFDFMRQATLEHHERLDGSGYPQHSKNVSTFGRLTAIADAFSAMLQKRPYAEAKDPMAAATDLANAPLLFDKSFSAKLQVGCVSNLFGKR